MYFDYKRILTCIFIRLVECAHDALCVVYEWGEKNSAINDQLSRDHIDKN